MANISEELMQLRKRARRRLVGAIALVVFALTVLWTALDGEPPKSLLENQTVEIISSAPALSSVVSLAPVAVGAVASQVAVASEVVAAPVVAPEPEASRVAPVALPGKLITHQSTAPQAVAAASSQTVAVAKSEPLPVEQVVANPTVRPTTKPTSKPVATAKPVVKPTEKPLPSIRPTAKPVKTSDPKAILNGSLEQTSVEEKKSDKIYYIQIGAFADPNKAAQTLKKLKDAGIPARSELVTTAKGELTRVRIGPGSDEAKAKAWLQRLDALGVPGTLVVKAAQ
ncbi:SPOR domain-containing protein [Chitinibacter sp. SCUT-21]|uniref:SPOR domain-containing protein n=1 Tax=Chitinibacter sp. SCUT-21 TaxID=2970891 RepID=UPI0035A65D87